MCYCFVCLTEVQVVQEVQGGSQTRLELTLNFLNITAC